MLGAVQGLTIAPSAVQGDGALTVAPDPNLAAILGNPAFVAANQKSSINGVRSGPFESSVPLS